MAAKKTPRKKTQKNVRTPRALAQGTGERIQAVALSLFQKKGFDRATMRDIAEAAGVSLGAAYHYFPSKEAIALAFYREHLEKHAEAVSAAIRRDMSLRERLEVVFESALDVRGADRGVLSALTRTVLDVGNPLSLFSPETRALRELSFATFGKAAEGDDVPAHLHEVLTLALWALHLGLLLRFVFDDSPGQSATRNLMRDAIDVVPSVVVIASTPIAAPFIHQLIDVLAKAGFLRRPRNE